MNKVFISLLFDMIWSAGNERPISIWLSSIKASNWEFPIDKEDNSNINMPR